MRERIRTRTIDARKAKRMLAPCRNRGTPDERPSEAARDPKAKRQARRFHRSAPDMRGRASREKLPLAREQPQSQGDAEAYFFFAFFAVFFAFFAVFFAFFAAMILLFPFSAFADLFLLLLRHVPIRRLGFAHRELLEPRGRRLRRPAHPIAAQRRS